MDTISSITLTKDNQLGELQNIQWSKLSHMLNTQEQLAAAWWYMCLLCLCAWASATTAHCFVPAFRMASCAPWKSEWFGMALTRSDDFYKEGFKPRLADECRSRRYQATLSLDGKENPKKQGSAVSAWISTEAPTAIESVDQKLPRRSLLPWWCTHRIYRPTGCLAASLGLQGVLQRRSLRTRARLWPRWGRSPSQRPLGSRDQQCPILSGAADGKMLQSQP